MVENAKKCRLYPTFTYTTTQYIAVEITWFVFMNTSPHQLHTCKSPSIKQFWNTKTLHFTVSYHSYTTLLLQKFVAAHTTSNNDNVTVLN